MSIKLQYAFLFLCLLHLLFTSVYPDNSWNTGRFSKNSKNPRSQLIHKWLISTLCNQSVKLASFAWVSQILKSVYCYIVNMAIGLILKWMMSIFGASYIIVIVCPVFLCYNTTEPCFKQSMQISLSSDCSRVEYKILDFGLLLPPFITEAWQPTKMSLADSLFHLLLLPACLASDECCHISPTTLKCTHHRWSSQCVT